MSARPPNGRRRIGRSARAAPRMPGEPIRELDNLLSLNLYLSFNRFSESLSPTVSKRRDGHDVRVGPRACR